MFGFFESEEKKTRSHAANWLEVAEKVYHFRRDVLAPTLLGELQGKTSAVRTSLKERHDAAKLKLAIEALEDVLRRTGGSHYPKSSWVENVEFFLVAAIVIIGIRTYFVQPFKIPTNSMWPSYNGMTHEVFATPEEEPSLALRAVRLATVGASHYEAKAPASGELQILSYEGSRLLAASRAVRGRKWLVLPTTNRQYFFRVGNETVSIEVPEDFGYAGVLEEGLHVLRKRTGTGSAPKIAEHLQMTLAPEAAAERVMWVNTGIVVKKGESILSFDILTGDNLFVDRLSYHFVKPKVGDGFVFRTDNLTSLHGWMAPGSPHEQYYIKRLVGEPGDKLRIADYTLYRNGAPITGSVAFDKNAKRIDKYPGYQNVGIFESAKTTYEVPGHSYLAMGDNSANSLDGRYWGPIPEKDVVGRPLWIYYPFTKRWGPAR